MFVEGAVDTAAPVARSQNQMARPSPGQFIQQVRAETSKVVWPTRRETITTTIMVFIMATLAAIFLTAVDGIIWYGLTSAGVI